MLPVDKAKELQSQIMKLAHTYKTGSRIDRNAVTAAANAVAQRNGYGSGVELQRLIGRSTAQPPKNKKPHVSTQPPSPDKVKPELVYRYIKLIQDNDGCVPLDWMLLREWTDVSATELRHARKAVIARGYEQIKSKGNQYVFELPKPDNLAPPSVNGASGGDEQDDTQVGRSLLILANQMSRIERKIDQLLDAWK